MSAVPLRVPEPPSDHRSWTADRKLRWTLDTLIGTTMYTPVNRPEMSFPKPGQIPSVARVVCSRSQLQKTLDHTGDTMPADRPKVIHTVGAVAPIELETLDTSPWTGLLAPPPAGGAAGVMRMSHAAPVTRNKAYVPGMAFKLFVDGAESRDLLAVNHTNGQGRDFNMFSNTLSHDLTDQHQELRPPQRLMKRLFKRVSHEPGRLSITHLADIDRTGEPVVSPNVPPKLVFSPTAAARDTFKGRPSHDFRDVLADIEPRTVLYDVMVEADGALTPVGALRTTGRFTASLGGDRMFFRHHQHAADRVRS